MDEAYINPEDSCFVDVAYSCPGEALDAEMESMLSNIVGDRGGFVNGRFAEQKRIAQFCFRHRKDADWFCKYVQENYPSAKTSLVLGFVDD